MERERCFLRRADLLGGAPLFESFGTGTPPNGLATVVLAAGGTSEGRSGSKNV